MNKNQHRVSSAFHQKLQEHDTAIDMDMGMGMGMTHDHRHHFEFEANSRFQFQHAILSRANVKQQSRVAKTIVS